MFGVDLNEYDKRVYEEEIRDFLEISSTSNVDQIYSRSIKFMRETWVKHV